MEGNKVFGVFSRSTVVVVTLFWLLALTIMVVHIYTRKRLEKEFLGESN
jgi:preprotein translocase subunit SecG